jgi:SAM-dependent methyltransferase
MYGKDLLEPENFARDDERPDTMFYKRPRFVNHLDSLALATIEDLMVRLLPKGSHVLDLMASHDSHLRPEISPSSVTGLGLNEEELAGNSMLTRRVVHDLNAQPSLPFSDEEFDAVINTVSVDYIVHPVEVFLEVARILKPDGRFVLIFSNRMFPPKAVNIWKQMNESQRWDLVKHYFQVSGHFFVEGTFESKGKPRPKDDKYCSYGIPSDPVYAIWAKKKVGGE